MGIPFIDTIVGALGTAADKIWMDKDKKEQIEFDRDQLKENMKLALEKMTQDGSLKQLELEFKESEAQREYAQEHFGTANILKDFFTGKMILFGRASIRWVITGFAMFQAHRIISVVLTKEFIAGIAAGTISTSGIWLASLLVCMTLGIPLFYVTGISIEKLFKARGVI